MTNNIDHFIGPQVFRSACSVLSIGPNKPMTTILVDEERAA